jgi:signal transduction histidine kinase
VGPVLVIVFWMSATVAAVGVLAYWDDQRESNAALDDFAREQVTLARAAAGAPVEGPDVVVLREEGDALVSKQRGAVRAPAIQAAMARGQDSVRLSRPEAAALGLPERTAMAGITHAPDGSAVVVVATALRERDREKRASLRLVLSVLLSSAIVLAFGTRALRDQRKELELAKELAVESAVRERDARLVRADKLATLGALGIGIAHEVATPLGVIVGRAEQLAPKVEGDERATRAVAAIQEQADRIGKIIRALLDLARGGASAFDRASPAKIAGDALEMVRHRFAKSGVTLVAKVSSNLPDVLCDTKLMPQVLVNLLLNACDACDASGRVLLAVTPVAGRVRFSVLDDGHGIPPDVAARVTEPFFTTKAPGEGSGLGLAIAREIVVHHRGSLRLESRKDGSRGTEATVELAAAPEEST